MKADSPPLPSLPKPLDDAEPAQRSVQWTRWTRRLVSLVVIFHLGAIVLPPFSFQASGPLGTSPAIETAIAPVRGYGQFVYVDRGYAFFAPDPGPSHLFQAAITDASGNVREHLVPSLDEQWPRLLYHRHFMLAEFMNEIYQPPGPPPELVELAPREAEYWLRARARYEHVRQSVVEHLEHKHPGQSVAIRRIEHLIPDILSFRERPVRLDDPESYRVMLDRPINVATPTVANPGQSARPAVGDLMAPSSPAPTSNLGPSKLGPPESVPAPPAASDTDDGAQP